jgi:predicted ABC-type ATPase
MVRLVHLNGPSGAGKSTLAQRYVDDHAGVLNLDIDMVVSLIGGWRNDFFATVSSARDIAIAMAETHLRSGSDVVMPQLVTATAQAERFEKAAQRAGASYVEVALILDSAEQIGRFRVKGRDSEVAAQIERAVDAEGGDAVLRRIHQHFTDYLEHRRGVLRLDVSGDVDQSYGGLLLTLSGS